MLYWLGLAVWQRSPGTEYNLTTDYLTGRGVVTDTDNLIYRVEMNISISPTLRKRFWCRNETF